MTRTISIAIRSTLCCLLVVPFATAASASVIYEFQVDPRSPIVGAGRLEIVPPPAGSGGWSTTDPADVIGLTVTLGFGGGEDLVALGGAFEQFELSSIDGTRLDDGYFLVRMPRTFPHGPGGPWVDLTWTFIFSRPLDSFGFSGIETDPSGIVKAIDGFPTFGTWGVPGTVEPDPDPDPDPVPEPFVSNLLVTAAVGWVGLRCRRASSRRPGLKGRPQDSIL